MDITCITVHNGFVPVCFNVWVLHTAYLQYSQAILLQAKQISKFVVTKKYVVTNTVFLLQAIQMLYILAAIVIRTNVPDFKIVVAVFLSITHMENKKRFITKYVLPGYVCVSSDLYKI